MRKLARINKAIAAFMLIVFTSNLLLPLAGHALTSGPAQPEMKGFEPASTASLVDPFTGDFTYNIPLMDVGGYPLNLAYHSGSGMDDEASWVGFGWSLSPGVIDRQMRGLPDDFNGSTEDGDKIIKEFHMRNDITGGVQIGFNPEVFGFDIGKVLHITPQAGIFYNNKRGLGIQFGLDANTPLLSNNKQTAGTNTAGLSGSSALSFNSQNGASFNPTVNFSITGKNLSDADKVMGGLGVGASFQSRAGLQSVSLAASFKNEMVPKEVKCRDLLNAATISYAAQTFLPETQANYFNASFSVAPQLGPAIWGFDPDLQLTGHYSIQKVANPVSSYNAYGFMHSNEGKNDGRALMDFNREKDVPYFDDVPNLPIPIATPDLFMVHAQDVSAQYRAYQGGTGIFSDHDALNTSVSASLGVELGVGLGLKTGADLQGSLNNTITTKWKSGSRLFFEDKNSYDAYGNFTGLGDGPGIDYEPVYFKRVGEQVPEDGSMYDNTIGENPVRVKTTGNISVAGASNVLISKNNTQTPLTKKLTRNDREPRNHTFSYLTTAQVKSVGLDKKVLDYYLSAGGFSPFLNKCAGNAVEANQQPYTKNHHIGEITITDEAGARKIYGVPAYNTYQEDVSFSVEQNTNAADKANGLISYTSTDASLHNKNGIDHFYSREIIPGYAHSFLLSGILSADYTDVKGDGITDDDLGSAVKFNYWRKSNKFQWRTPYATGKANYNEGLVSDKMDDRANYSYGQKELWYTHSIESKTMVAVFETGNREDALGADVTGNRDTAEHNRQQYLKTISLYAKADWYKDPATAMAIKTVHFVYDYSLFAAADNMAGGVPNNSGTPIAGNSNITANQGGKLTLKNIYFTYQGNTKGALQPYEFQYDFNKPYNWKQYDRWGNYKNAADDNPAGVSNDYYAYSTQNKKKADINAAVWQLTKITTPAGAIITIQYEADDYMYVQDRKAMEMYPIAGIGEAVNQNDKYYGGDIIYVKLPAPMSSDAALRAKYFDGGVNDYSRNLFFKAFVKLNNEEKYDYVSGYAEIGNIITDVKLAAGYNDIAEIKVKKIKGEGTAREYHPIAKAAWQFMRLNTPSLVYPGYNVREELAPVQFIRALVGAITSITELLAPFDTRAEINKLAPAIDLRKSWVRLDASANSTKTKNGLNCSAKLGGGSRVKEIDMSDDWSNMSQSAAPTAVYGMLYDYTTTEKLSNGEDVMISSGVASYEPMIGNEENPFHQPSKFQQKIKLGPDNAFFIDEPLCESYFPAAGVGYSKVTVRNKGADGQVGATGCTVSEFYTQKDFPVTVDHTPIDARSFGITGILQLLKVKKNNSRVVSQGYSVKVNDMHGKPKSEKVIDKGGNELSSVYYYYKTTNADVPEKKLNNEALVLHSDGTTGHAIIGRDIEFYTDMRSQTSFTAGINVMVNVDALYVFFALIPVPAILPLPNAQYAAFRSASSIKLIQEYGILDKVVKQQNGSQTTTENIAWDAGTGEVLLTRTQNEFDDPQYSFNYPAHWKYDTGMGQAYKNMGLLMTDFSCTGGIIKASPATPLLVPGDELLVKDELNRYKKYWVNRAGVTVPQKLVVIDENGIPVTLLNVNASIVRSGRRNMHSLPAGTLVSMVNPIKNGRLDIGAFTKVLDAGGHIYNDEWSVEAKNVVQTIRECPPGYTTDANGLCYKEVDTIIAPSYSVNTTVIRQRNNLYTTCGTLLNNFTGSYLAPGAADPGGANKVLLNTPGTWQNGPLSCSVGTAGDADGPLNRSGIWLAERKNNNYYNQWVGIKSKIYISSFDVNNKSADGKTGYLFLVFGSQHSIEIRIDNVVVATRNRNTDGTSSSPMRSWRIKPISLTLDQQHEIFIKVKNEVAGSEAVMGVELYNNTYEELKTSTCVYENCLPCKFCAACRTDNTSQVNAQFCFTKIFANAVWSTKCLAGKRFNYHSNANGVSLVDFDPLCKGTLVEDANCDLKCRTKLRIYAPAVSNTYCSSSAGQVINPYTIGLRGNWRLQKSFVYHTDRESILPYSKPGDPAVIEKTDIRKSGAYTIFSPFWKYENNQWLSQQDLLIKDRGWVKANELTVFTQKGQEIESVDALGRYSAAQFGYLQSLVTAVASNARYTEIAYDGFEDYDVDTGNCNGTDTCNLNGHFTIRKLSRRYPAHIIPDAAYAHTGRNSLKITGAADAMIIQPIVQTTGSALYTFTGAYMNISNNGILSGFKPQPGKQYLLSAWVKDDGDNVQLGAAMEMNKAAVEVITGGQTYSTMKAGPKVEGWRKVELIFLLPATATDIKIRFRPGNNTAWFDDVRIHPYDAQLKTYAYDNRSMRLWAEMDENNFATFYEYDDEGVLIRIKKETEKGIMTIKESRSSYKMQK